MRSPYCIGVWKPSLSDAAAWVSQHHLGDNVIQFVPEGTLNGAVWIMLRVTGDQRNTIIQTPTTTVVF